MANFNNLNIYSVEDPTPRQVDVIRELLTEYEVERNILITVSDQGEWVLGKPMLVLGSQGPASGWGSGLQYTYSAKQFETKANAKTVFFAALDNYFGLVEGLPSELSMKQLWTAQFFKVYTLRDFDLTEPIAIDVETGGTLGGDVTARTAPMLTIALAQGENAVVLKMVRGFEETEYVHQLRVESNLRYLRWFLGKVEKPIFHNGKFDIAVIENNVGIRMPNWFDTMLAHHVLNIAAREHGLKALCRRYFDAPDWEADIKQWIKGKNQDYSTIPARTLAQYNMYDVLWTYRLWQKLSIEIEADEDAERALYLEMQTADFLYDVEKVGIPVSEDQIDKLLVHYGDEAGEALDRLRSLTLRPEFNPNSPKQVKEFLESEGLFFPSTNEETIDLIAESAEGLVLEFCVELIKFRKAKKMSGTYVNGWWKAAVVEQDSRAHPTFHVHGTVTGRLSSSEPNAQNVPRDKTIRKMVTIDEVNQLD